MQPVLRPIISREQIQVRLGELAAQINRDYAGQSLVVVGILKGAFIFLADLVRLLEPPVRIDFVRLRSYGNRDTSSGQVAITKDLELDITATHVLVVEDIIDSGLTIQFLLTHLEQRRPKSVKVCCLIDKRERRACTVPLDYVGFVVPRGFLVGYGLDYAEDYRQFPDICELEP